ncbi:MAG: glycosyltransferase [Chitinispirillaceae bacterium]
MLESIAGESIITKFLFYAGLALVIGDFAATIFAILYQRIIYQKLMRPKYNDSFNPKCSVIVPCKGIPKNFGKNLRGFLQLDYPTFEVIYVVESESDSAVPEIEKITSEDKRAKLVVAGISKACAQKNHNMLAALEQADNPDVYVFADSDIKPGKNWLKEIVLPLVNPKVTVTTGFRWLLSNKGTIGELTHSYVNIFIYTCFCAACYFGGVGLWGGSMAIRRKDFEELGVAQKWSKAAVDDMSLSSVVLKQGRRAVVVPTCVTVTDDLLPTMKSTIVWFERQIMFLKAYQRKLWFFPTLPLALTAGIILMLFPFALFGSMVSGYTFWELGGGVALVFYLGHTFTALWYPLLGKMPYFHKFLLLQPLLRLTHVLSYFRTYLTRTITWAGIKYYLTINGDVDRIERPSELGV